METEQPTETTAAEGAPNPEAAAAAPESSAAGAAPATPRTFTDEQVQEIVRGRVKAYEKFGKPEELEARFTRAQQIEQWRENLSRQMGQPGSLPGQKQTGEPLSEEDKKVLAYMDRIMPGFSKTRDMIAQIQEQQQQSEAFKWNSISEKNEMTLKGWAKEAGYKDEHFGEISNRVAHSIMANKVDFDAYLKNNGSAEIVKKHFQALDTWLKQYAPATPPVSAQAGYAQQKTGTKGLPPRMPSAGVPAPTASKAKRSDKERIDAAFNAYTGKAA